MQLLKQRYFSIRTKISYYKYRLKAKITSNDGNYGFGSWETTFKKRFSNLNLNIN